MFVFINKLYYISGIINNLIEDDMRYNFETKATKEYITKVAKRIEEDVVKIMPTKFSLDVEVEEKEILNNIINNYQISINRSCVKGVKYCIDGEIFDLIAPLLSRATMLLVSFIRINIIYNSNYVEIKENDYIAFSGLKRNCFYDSIDEAVKYNIISKTTRKSIYVVNHNMIFKGNVGEFITKYKIKYPNGCKTDSNGKIVLEH